MAAEIMDLVNLPARRPCKFLTWGLDVKALQSVFGNPRRLPQMLFLLVV